MPAGRERRTVYYSGRVQGVGFRYTAAATAQGYDVQGFVKNLPDGRVELVVEGSRVEVVNFLSALAERMEAYIQRAATDIGAATGEFDAFEIRH